MKQKEKKCTLRGCAEKAQEASGLCQPHQAITPPRLLRGYSAARKSGDTAREKAAAAEILQWHRATRTVWTQEDFSAQHGPLVDILVRLTSERTVEQGKRRRSDAWMFSKLSQIQQSAANTIVMARLILTGGLAAKAQNFSSARSGGKGEISNHAARLACDYVRWGKEVKLKGLSLEMAMDALCENLTLKQVDRKHQRRDQTALENLISCLDLWLHLYGF